MNDDIDLQLFLGQYAADALVRDATLIALMEVIPDLHARLEAKVLVSAHGTEKQLPEGSREAFRSRLQEVREFLYAATPPADDAMGAPG